MPACKSMYKYMVFLRTKSKLHGDEVRSLKLALLAIFGRE